MDVEKPMGHLIVNAGGGTVDVSVVSLNGIVCSKSIKMGGEKIDKDIVSLIKRQFNLSIGMSTAEEIKIKIATLNKCDQGVVFGHESAGDGAVALGPGVAVRDQGGRLVSALL